MQFSFTKIFYLINAVLLCLAIGFVAFFITLQVKPEFVDFYGKGRIKLYTDSGVKHANAAIADLKKDDTKRAEDLLEKWHDIYKSDRLYLQKRGLFLKLADYWNAQGEFEKTLETAPEYMQLDERDIGYFMRWAKAALNVEATREQAKIDVENTWNRFPTSENISYLYVENVVDKNDNAKLKAIIDNFQFDDQSTLLATGWGVYWAERGGFTGRKRTPATAQKFKDGWRLEVFIPSNSRVIRIDPPGTTVMNISDIRVDVGQKSQTYAVEDITSMNMMTIVDGKLQTSGGNDPFFSLALNPDPGAKPSKAIKVNIYLKLSRQAPDWYQTLTKRVE